MLNISITDIFSVVIAACKDYEQKKCLEQLRAASHEVDAAEADSRRKIASGIIINMAALDFKIRTLKNEYSIYRKKYNQPIPAFEEYISKLERERKRMSELKNKKRMS